MSDLLTPDVERLRKDVAAGAETVSFAADLPAGLAAKILDLIDKETAGGAIVVGVEEELSPAQAASILGVSRPFVSRLVAAGGIDARRVGAHWRIPVSALREYQDRMASAKHSAVDNYADALNEAGIFR
jgi:excisionase family DNA binding protein